MPEASREVALPASVVPKTVASKPAKRAELN
jgi:hypothetical protein